MNEICRSFYYGLQKWYKLNQKEKTFSSLLQFFSYFYYIILHIISQYQIKKIKTLLFKLSDKLIKLELIEDLHSKTYYKAPIRLSN